MGAKRPKSLVVISVLNSAIVSIKPRTGKES